MQMADTDDLAGNALHHGAHFIARKGRRPPRQAGGLNLDRAYEHRQVVRDPMIGLLEERRLGSRNLLAHHSHGDLPFTQSLAPEPPSVRRFLQVNYSIKSMS